MSPLPHRVRPRDLVGLAERIERHAPDIEVVLTTPRRADQWPLLLHPLRPTLSVVFGPLARRKYLAGRILDCPRLAKHAELAALAAAGIPVPRWELIRPGTQLDPDQWGPYVVVKPTRSANGVGVRIRRTTRVRWAPPEAGAAEPRKGEDALIAQRFVYTGRWPVSYRVCTFLGRALYCWRAEQSHDKRPLEGRFAFAGPGGAGGGIQIIAPSKKSSYSLVVEEEMIALAERAHRLALPDHPYLGMDLVRDAETREVWVLEANSGGAVWHLSSDLGIGLMREHGFDLYSQLGALDRAAEALVEATRTRALVAPLGRRSRPAPAPDRIPPRDAPAGLRDPALPG
jgi:hypothetical protein